MKIIFKLVMICLCSFMYTNVLAVNYVCGTDLDGDGYSDGDNETTACIRSSASQYFCPIQATACSTINVSDLDQASCSSYGGNWVSGGVERSSERYDEDDYHVWVWVPKHDAKFIWAKKTIASVSDRSSFKSGEWTYHKGSKKFSGWGVAMYAIYRTRNKPAKCSMPDGSTVVQSNPLGNGEACQLIDNQWVASKNKCIDLDNTEPEEEFDISGDMLTDDGERDGEGNCIDQIMLFTGRAQACKKAGLQSAYKNCCSFDGELANEDIGTLQQTKLKMDAIHGIYQLSQTAYTAYSSAIAAGASQGAAASAAGTAAGQQMMVAFDPTTLAIAAGVYLVTEWVANACSDSDLETAAAKATGHCVEVGEFCSKKIKWIGCVQRKRSFCCFNGKMQKIFHEQGRPQLTTFGSNSFGSAKSPNCRGFTPEEFQAIDFSKIDLSEYYEELNHNTSVEVNSVMKDKTKDFYESVK
jgi:hypothetical protein